VAGDTHTGGDDQLIDVFRFDGLATNVEELEASQVSIIPNPFHSYFQVNCSDGNNLNLELFNQLGQQVFQKEINCNNPTVDFGSQSQGIYLAIIRKGSRIIYSQKLIRE